MMMMMMMLVVLVLVALLVVKMKMTVVLYCFRGLKAPSGRQKRCMLSDDQKINLLRWISWKSTGYDL